MTSIQSAASNELDTIKRVRESLKVQKFLMGRKPVNEAWLDVLEKIYAFIVSDQPKEAKNLLRNFGDRSIVYQVPKEIRNYLNNN
jgi:hypothetical protein